VTENIQIAKYSGDNVLILLNNNRVVTLIYH